MRSGSLPAPLDDFVGREAELAEVARLLAGDPPPVRLLTLTGPGGAGKSRLALEAAARLAGGFEGGTALVELAPVTDAGRVPAAVATVAGVREGIEQPLTDSLAGHFASRHALLVLDNCEHLVVACAALAEVLLRACPRLVVLATSREPLDVAGEIVRTVPPLSVPPAGGDVTPAHLEQYEATRLFLRRAAAGGGRPLAAPTSDESAAIAEVCRRLDGLPLAVELAAARARALTPAQIAARLDDRFRLLTGGRRTALPRQQTLAATLDWSYALLSIEEQVLFRRLAVFAGGFTLEAAEGVGAGEGLAAGDVLDRLARLVDRSLVVAGASGAEARYRLLETVRQYASERLAEAGEAGAVRARHARQYGALAEAAAPELNTRSRTRWVSRLDAEHENVVEALAWHRRRAAGDRPADLLKMAASLWWYWFHGGRWSEGRAWLGIALSAGGQEGSTEPDRATALLGAGVPAWAQGDHPAAQRHLEESVTLSRRAGHPSTLAHALHFLAMTVLGRGDVSRARALATESVEIFRAGDDPFGLGVAMASRGIVAVSERDSATAEALLAESATRLRAAGDDWGASLPLRNLAVDAFRRGDYPRAVALHQEAIRLLQPREEEWFLSRSLESLAETLALVGEPLRAARLFGAAERLRQRIGAAVLAFYRPDYDRAQTALRAALDPQTLEAAWAEGQAMSLAEAVACALDGPGGPPSVAPAAPAPRADPVAVLTPREREVAALLARGMTNRQIAVTLVVTEKTAEAHVSHILAKLGLTSRAQAAVWAAQHRLGP